MRIEATPGAVEFIREHGGRLHVWVRGAACCGGTRFIESSTERPDDLAKFVRIDQSDFDLYIRPAGAMLPEELTVDLRGWRRPRVAASWNGCPYLL